GRLIDALAISDSVQPTASTAPRKPAATGVMPASRCPNSGTYISTIVVAIKTPIVTYIHFNGPGPNAARGNTVAPARRSTTRKHPTSATPRASSPDVADAMLCTPARLMASAAAPSNNSDHTGIRANARGVTSDSRRDGNALGTSAAIAAVTIASDPKAQRQIPNWANRPPMAGPMMTLMPHIADTNA